MVAFYVHVGSAGSLDWGEVYPIFFGFFLIFLTLQSPLVQHVKAILHAFQFREVLFGNVCLSVNCSNRGDC